LEGGGFGSSVIAANQVRDRDHTPAAFAAQMNLLHEGLASAGAKAGALTIRRGVLSQAGAGQGQNQK
jgi:hypothetical protein